MSATHEDLDNMKPDEAVHYLQSKIHAHKSGIRYCQEMIEKYR